MSDKYSNRPLTEKEKKQLKPLAHRFKLWHPEPRRGGTVEDSATWMWLRVEMSRGRDMFLRPAGGYQDQEKKGWYINSSQNWFPSLELAMAEVVASLLESK